MTEREVHLGIVVYYWGWRSQDRLLVECLGPLAREFGQQGLADRFWFDRFDARGPHLFAIVTVQAPALPEVAARAVAVLESYLAAQPSREEMSCEEIAARHAECRGKRQCAVDGYPGLATNNTFHVFTHPIQAYPFWLSAGLPREADLWCLLSDLAFWAIEQLAPLDESSPTASAVWLAAAIDRELQHVGSPAAEYWRYHATTLLLGFADRLQEREADVIGGLASAIGVHNRQALLDAWRWCEEHPPLWPELPRLTQCLASEVLSESRRWPLLREILHSALKQLGVPVAQHVPLVLFAWQRNLPVTAAGHGEERR